MPLPQITQLIEFLRSEFGDLYRPYGTSSEEFDGTGFRLADIPATFSVVCSSPDTLIFNIQVESFPPGDYIYIADLDQSSLLTFIRQFKQPQELWPVNA